MAEPTIPRIIRGRLFYQAADVFFPTFAQAATAWSAAQCHRLDIAEQIDQLTIDQLASLSETRRAGKDQAGFSATCEARSRAGSSHLSVAGEVSHG